MLFDNSFTEIVFKIEDSTSSRSLNLKQIIWCYAASCARMHMRRYAERVALRGAVWSLVSVSHTHTHIKRGPLYFGASPYMFRKKGRGVGVGRGGGAWGVGGVAWEAWQASETLHKRHVL